MLEIGRAEILRPGVQVSEDDGTRDMGMRGVHTKYGLNRPDDDEFRPTGVGEVIEFTGSTYFRKDNSLLVVKGISSNNGVVAKVYEEPSTTFTPRIIRAEAVWEKRFGENPRNSAFETFGDPATLTAEFQGHSERDVFSPLMANQEEAFDPELSIVTDQKTYGQPSGHENTISTTLMFAGPVVRTNIYGLTEVEYARENAKPEGGFTGKFMLGGRLKTHSIGVMPEFELISATIADSDDLFRLDVNRVNHMVYPAENIPKAMTSLAELSVYARTLQAPTPQNFPVELLYYLGMGMSRQLTNPNPSLEPVYENLKNKHGIDWIEVTAGLPNDAVQTEAERLYDVFIHADLHAKK